MPDDLSKLTPTDPSAVDPEWSSRRKGILDGVLAAKPTRRGVWRWVAGSAAVTLLVVAVAGIAQLVRDEPHATPASPTQASMGRQVLAARSLLLSPGEDVGVCLGVVAESLPPQCRTIPVTGITWGEVPWAETAAGVTFGDAIIVGTFDGTTFQATTVHRHDDPAAPQPPDPGSQSDLPRLCEAPTSGTGSPSTDALVAVVESLPGYQGLWVSPDQVTFNVAVAQDIEGARTAVAAAFGGEFCVGTVDGPTDEAMGAAQQALEPLTLGPLMQDPPADLNDGDSIWGASHTVTARGNRLQVDVVRQSPELLDDVKSLVGPEVWEYTDVVPFFYPVEDLSAIPDPTSTSPSRTPAGNGQPVALEGHLMDVDGVMGICYGGLDLELPLGRAQENPPSCRGGFVPVVGLQMPTAQERSGILVGTFDGSRFHATRLYHYGEPGAPHSPLYTMPPEPADICDEETGTGASTDWDELRRAAEQLPGYQGQWLLSDLSADHHRVAVTHGVEEAQERLLSEFGLQLCVGTVPGPTESTLRTAGDAVAALWPREPGELEPFVHTDVWAEAIGTSLRVSVLDDTQDILSAVEAAVGPEVWPHTKVIPRLFPVGAAALEPRVETPTPMPPGPSTPLVITPEDRQRAEESVARDLEDATGTAATAMMAKATFAQYEALWNIDVPHPPGPPSGDTEVLVVTLSAPLENRVTRGGPAMSPKPSATGSLHVIDADTGESIIDATLLGDEPQTERISQFPGPVETVQLPEGFR